MAAILRRMRVLSASPITLDTPFDVELDFINFPPDDPSPSTTVKFWCDAAFSVAPTHLPLTPPPDHSFKVLHQLLLHGPAGSALVRVLGQCDEIHSAIVEVA